MSSEIRRRPRPWARGADVELDDVDEVVVSINAIVSPLSNDFEPLPGVAAIGA